MPTPLEKIQNRISTFAQVKPAAFGIVLATFGLMTILFMVTALTALLSGPIGIELQDDYFSSSVSRLVVLQASASLCLVSLVFFLMAVLNWPAAPDWLRTLCGAALWRTLLCHRQTRTYAGHLAVYWTVTLFAAVTVNVAMLADLPVIAMIEPDSVGYLQPSALRSSGYMLFIQAVTALLGELHWIVAVQLNFMLASFIALGWAVLFVLRSLVAGLVVALVPMFSAGILILSVAVMTEALFISLMCTHLAAVLFCFRRLSWTNVLLVGVTLGLMIVVRPNGISFVAGLPLLVFLLRNSWRKVLVGGVGPLVAIVVAQGLYHHHTFGFFGLHKFSGISLAGSAAPLMNAGMPPSAYPELTRELEARFEAYYVDFPPFDARVYPFEMADVASLTAVGAIYKVILPALRDRLGLPEPEAVAFEYDPRIDKIAGELALAAILNDPWGYFKIVTSNYIANWHRTLPIRVPLSVYYPRNFRLSQEQVKTHAELLSRYVDLAAYSDPVLAARFDDVGSKGIRPIEWPRMAISVFQVMLGYMAFAVSLWGLLAVVKAKHMLHADWRVLSYSALQLQAGYGLISIGNASFNRYTVAFDPLVILLLVAGVAVLHRWATGAGSSGFPAARDDGEQNEVGQQPPR